MKFPRLITLTSKTLNQTTRGYVWNGLVGAYLIHTNHLSDRELYEFLCSYLTEEVVLFPENPDYAYIIDLVGGAEGGSNEAVQIYLKYYADEKARVKWGHDWPGDKIPKHEDPPFDRDRFLPQAALV